MQMYMNHYLPYLFNRLPISLSKDSDIVRAIINNVAPRCGCAFTEDQITLSEVSSVFCPPLGQLHIEPGFVGLQGQLWQT